MFVFAIILILSLVLLVSYGMTALVIILLAIGILGSLVSSFIFLIWNGKEIEKKIASKQQGQPRPVLLTSESYELKGSDDEVVKEKKTKNVHTTKAPTTKKQTMKKQNKSSSGKPIMKHESDYMASSSVGEEDSRKKVCPHCKYKNYSSEIVCQNCGARLK